MANKRRQPDFRTQALAELARQLHYAPKARRLEQLQRAERLHDEIDPQSNYPFDYIAYRITRIRQQSDETVLLVGEAIRPDLRLIIDALSWLHPPTVAEVPTYTTEGLAQALSVSTRTVHRWRDQGLRWRWVRVDGQRRPRIGFTEQALSAFRGFRPGRVEQASRFAHLSEAERQHLLRRARRLAAVTEATPHQVARHLAHRTGRGIETIRQLLEQHDREAPDQRIFMRHSSPLTPKQQRIIARAHRFGIPVGHLARRFQRSRGSIYRVINERRAGEAQRIALGHIDAPTFRRDDAAEVLLREGVIEEALATATAPPAGMFHELPESWRTIYDQPTLEDRWQRFLLLRYNYLKYEAQTLRSGFDRHHPRASALNAFDQRLAELRELRALLIRVNLSTVLSLARRHLLDKPDPGRKRLLHLLSLGHRVLDQAIETYDPTRSQGFAAYLSNRLMRRFANDPAVSDESPGKAHRRLSEAAALDWLKADAHAAGIPLPETFINNQPQADRDATP
jgi:AraC-like DNA-binding protein